MFYYLHSLTAGLWSFIWHWGVGIGAIVLLVAGAVFSTSIPIIGPYLEHLRKDLLWAAAAIALVLAGEWLGARDASHRCQAKAVVVVKHVKQIVKSVKTRSAASQPDRWNDPNN